MNEIHLYHSIWKNAVIILVGLIFSALGVYLMLNGKNGFLVWASTIFFGLGALFILYLLVVVITFFLVLAVIAIGISGNLCPRGTVRKKVYFIPPFFYLCTNTTD